MDQPLRDWIEGNLDRLYGFAFALSQDSDQARELVQESVMHALSAARWPDGPDTYRAWMFRILRNAFVDRYRKAGRELSLDGTEDVADEWSGGSGSERKMIDIITVRIAVGRLSIDHREIIALIDFAGFSYGQAADVLGVAEGTVMSRIARARKALLKTMAEDNVTPLARSRRTRR
ncbi:RNA polymerase sigma factor [Roseibium aggregatum]|uniref:RNA polymerase sigma factor n=1 Tax=Roseibium aggregatum TaxID=187304 RepID=UPI002E2D6BBF|nr:RNA polymerase sigma factor [Roseibium aggregatum]